MKKELIKQLHRDFEQCAQQRDGVEFRYTRELQTLLGYTTWRRFEETIDRAKIACSIAGQHIEHHFADAGKMVGLGSGSSREINDLELTRYARYLIAQNGDPRKDAIAFAMTYFAVQAHNFRRSSQTVTQRMEPQHG